jgi:L-lactate dehydrogenase (cytochrome)
MSNIQNTAPAEAVAAEKPISWRTATAGGPRILQKILCLDDFEAPARKRIPRPIFGFIVSGSESDASMRANQAAYEAVGFVPRVMVDTGERTPKTTLFGRTYDLPFGFSPMGGNNMSAYEADLVLSRVAAKCNIPAILSGGALTPLEKVREVGPTTWFQAYLPGDNAAITRLVDRVARAGYDTFCVTVDVSVAANLETAVRMGFSKPIRPSLRLAWEGVTHPRWLVGVFARTLLTHGMPHVENMATSRPPVFSVGKENDRGRIDTFSWRHLELIRRLWKGKLVVKGILNRQDARLARETGVDGVIVSNHGGRQLDSSVSPLRVLPGIVAEAGDMTVMMDSGVRRGTHVLKALGLGAKFVFIGRPALYAAAIGGEAGVLHCVRLLRDELNRDMALLGITTLGEMNRDRLMKATEFEGM